MSDECKLVVTENYSRGARTYSICWYFPDEDDHGGHLGQSSDDGLGNPPKDRDDWEGWAANKAVREAFPGVVPYAGSVNGFTFETEKEAKAALKIANAALKGERQMPEWAVKALAEGWKAPKGWKP